MSVESIARTSGEAAPDTRASGGLRQRIADRRELARLDRASARLADLHCARKLLTEAAFVVEAGWIQHGWFAYRDEQGRQQLVDAYSLHRMAGRRPTAACLVGAIVQAGGGVPAAHSQPVHRALDLTWQVLLGVDEPVENCPAPALRLVRMRELTAWNDRPGRMAHEVSALLVAAGRRATEQLERKTAPAL